MCQVIFLINSVFFCLKIFLTFTNSEDPEEMQFYAAFHLGLHCLQQKYLFRGFLNTKGEVLKSHQPAIFDCNCKPAICNLKHCFKDSFICFFDSYDSFHGCLSGVIISYQIGNKLFHCMIVLIQSSNHSIWSFN